MVILFWKFFLPTLLIEPTRLFDFGNFSYLHIISNCTLIKEVRVVFNPTLLSNEGILRALKGKKIRLKNPMVLPLIFELILVIRI